MIDDKLAGFIILMSSVVGLMLGAAFSNTVRYILDKLMGFIKGKDAH